MSSYTSQKLFQLHATYHHPEILQFSSYRCLLISSILYVMNLSFAGYICDCCLQLPFVRVNTLRPRQDSRYFPDDHFKRIILYENARIATKIALKVVPKCPINNCPSLVQMMA